MNETNLTSRQKYILNLITQSEGLLREEIQKNIAYIYDISKPTLIRDLDALAKAKLIKIAGKGKNTKYFPFIGPQILRKFDIDQYFLLEPDRRTSARKTFDFDVFNQLNHLFDTYEKDIINKVKAGFSEKEKELPSDILKKELERFVIELSWKSSKIEGNTYTLLETEALIKKSKEADNKTKEEAVMILNHKDAFEEILKRRSEFKKINLTDINQLHNTLVKGLNISTGIRKVPVGITGTVYQPLDNQHQLQEAMEKLVGLINETGDVLEKALIAMAVISYIQAYSDGNKRTGRMLTNAILLAHDYYPISYRSVDEVEFKKALILFYEQGSIYHLKRLFIEQLVFSYETYFK